MRFWIIHFLVQILGTILGRCYVKNFRRRPAVANIFTQTLSPPPTIKASYGPTYPFYTIDSMTCCETVSYIFLINL